MVEDEEEIRYGWEPSCKSSAIDLFIARFMGRSREIQIASNLCMTCQGEAITFRDKLSEQEYTISGMCQICQDQIFLGGE